MIAAAEVGLLKATRVGGARKMRRVEGTDSASVCILFYDHASSQGGHVNKSRASMSKWIDDYRFLRGARLMENIKKIGYQKQHMAGFKLKNKPTARYSSHIHEVHVAVCLLTKRTENYVTDAVWSLGRACPLRGGFPVPM